eukprot:TRINITY_DN5442_c0_g1_i1.p1 TRINITY_DN5442_c0_g1~~TRINITY_DN5442_c0_g1_i1.p1  ORF type:complete len:485 (-),score=85.84 TRINITY_DN5442_c0_g1_i1:91-1545(-)
MRSLGPTQTSHHGSLVRTRTRNGCRYDFSLWLQHRSIGYDFAQIMYINLFTWVTTLMLSPRHHSNVSRDLHLMEVPFSTWSWHCAQTKPAIDTLHSHLSQAVIPVKGYKQQQAQPGGGLFFDVVLARMLARCAAGAYCNLHAKSRGEPFTKQHTIFDCRDALSMVARAANTQVIEMFSAPETDTNAALFEQLYEGHHSSGRGRELTRLVVAFRGTESNTNVKTDIDTQQVRFVAADGSVGGWQHKGFSEALESISEQLLSRLREVTAVLPKPVELCVCGHSLGGALAALFALTAARDPSLQLRVRCYTFGQPRFGDASLAQMVDDAVPDYWRVAHRGDPVCRVPGIVNLKSFRQHCGTRRYKHAGQHVQLQTGGQMVFSPTPVETFLENTNVFNHSLVRYEGTLELCLRNRHRWLWRKAVLIVRVAVGLMLSARACEVRRQSQRDSGRKLEQFSIEGPNKTSGLSRNPLFVTRAKATEDETLVL